MLVKVVGNGNISKRISVVLVFLGGFFCWPQTFFLQNMSGSEREEAVNFLMACPCASDSLVFRQLEHAR